MEYSGGKLYLSWQTFLATCTLWHSKALMAVKSQLIPTGDIKVLA